MKFLLHLIFMDRKFDSVGEGRSGSKLISIEFFILYFMETLYIFLKSLFIIVPKGRQTFDHTISTDEYNMF